MKNKVKYDDLTNADLQNRLKEIGNELVAGRQKFRIGQFKKTSDFLKLRREVARIKTLIRQRELAETKKTVEKKRA